MKTLGRARRQVIERLCPRGELVVDVGADHGHVAHALGAIATERRPHRRGRPDVPWVVADGLAPFREVPVAIIAGMGALRIAGILDRGPRPRVLIAHAQDDPPTLRRYLARHGWMIEAEALAPEGNRYAEVLRATAGQESASGVVLDLGPRLVEGDDPWWVPHLEHVHQHWSAIAEATRAHDAVKYAYAVEMSSYAQTLLRRQSRSP